jgi:hypothetical protein
MSPHNEMRSLILLKKFLKENLQTVSNKSQNLDQRILEKTKLEKTLKSVQRLCYEFTLKSRKETPQPLSSVEQKKVEAFFHWIAQNGIQHKLDMAKFSTTGS